MFLKQLAAKFRLQVLVYQFAGKRKEPRLDTGSSEETWLPANEHSVRRLFGNDAARCRSFLHFLHAGHFGLFCKQGGQWVGYGWCAQPGGAPPPHLPSGTRELNAYWVFYCHIRAEFRGHGLYKRLLTRLVSTAQEREGQPLVLCDTLPGNFPARSAALQSGFTPVGVLTTYRLRSWILGGKWQRERAHFPPMPAHPAAVAPVSAAAPPAMKAASLPYAPAKAAAAGAGVSSAVVGASGMTERGGG